MHSNPFFSLSNPFFVIGEVGGAFIILLFGLLYLVRARVRARVTDTLEQRGRAAAVEMTSIRFKALNRMGSSYGLVSFTYEYEGKVYASKQAIEELSAQDLLKGSTHPCVLVLPEKPRCARLALTKTSVYHDPTIGRDTAAGIIIILFPFLAVGMMGVAFLIVSFQGAH